MVGLLPLLLLRPYMGTFTLRMPRPITALGMASGGINWWVPYVAGDADGTLYEPDPHAANPIGRVPGRVLARPPRRRLGVRSQGVVARASRLR